MCRALKEEGGHVAAVDIVGVGGYRVAAVVRKGRAAGGERPVQLELSLLTSAATRSAATPCPDTGEERCARWEELGVTRLG